MDINIRTPDHRRDPGDRARQKIADYDARQAGFKDALFIEAVSYTDGDVTGTEYRFKAREVASGG